MIPSRKKLLSIEKSVWQQLRAKNISRVAATVSGGPDSIALLCALNASGADVTALHCNFHLRGEESMRDQHHVEQICQSFGISLLTKDFDVESYMASNKGTSVEMACRSLRYEWFYETARQLNADRIATGHNADDNIETFFINLLRGAGTSGLKGMLPDNGLLWRPLLAFHRREIEEYLINKGVSAVTDSTNLESDYRRNFLRNEIIPLLRSRWEGFDKALDRSISLVRSENRIVDKAVADVLPADGEPLTAATVTGFPDPGLLVRRFIEPCGPFTTTAEEIVAAIKAAKPDVRRWQLRKGTITLRGGKIFRNFTTV